MPPKKIDSPHDYFATWQILIRGPPNFPPLLPTTSTRSLFSPLPKNAFLLLSPQLRTPKLT